MAVDLISDVFNLVAVVEDDVDALDLVLVLEEGKVAHVAHDVRETLQRHLVDVRRLQTQQRVLQMEIEKKSIPDIF